MFQDYITSVQCTFSFSSLSIGFVPSRSHHQVKDVLLRPPPVVRAEFCLFPTSSVRQPKADAYGALP